LTFLSTLFFCFSLSGALLDLHSFPTRRSSDLGSIPLGGLVRIPGMHRPAGADVEAFMSTALHEDPSLAPFVQRVRRDLDAGDLSDRKSTRLNSSHRTISYAVFCLKKKKTEKRP